MLLQITLFEIKYRLQRPATYLYFFILFLLSYLVITLPDSSVSDAGEQLHKNAPYVIYQLVTGFGVFSSIILAGIMGVPVYREFEYNFNEIIFSLPVKKWDYLGGKFLGSYVIALFVHLGLVLGLLVGTLMPWVEKSDLGPFMLEAYINPIFIFLIPNLFILGVLFFAVGSTFRSQLAIYSQGLVLIVLYFVLSKLMQDVDTNPVNSVFEPFGSVAASFQTKYWTTFEKNTMFLPFSGYILINRIVWILFAAVVWIVFYVSFKTSSVGSARRKKAGVEETSFVSIKKTAISYVSGSFSAKDQVYQWWYFSKFQFFKIIKAIPFAIMMLCGVAFLLLGRMGLSMLGTPSLPVTYMLLSFLQGIFIIFAIIIIAVYTGEIIWKDIDVKLAPIVDSSPMPDWLVVISKFTAMVMVELFILFLIMLTGIGVQIYSHFYHFQLLVYIKVLMFQTFPFLVVFTFFIFLIHTLTNNKFVGHTLVIVMFLFSLFFDKLGLEHVLFHYGSTIEKPYSDMNGFSHFVYPALTVDFYWLMLGMVFLILSVLFIKRGSEFSPEARWQSFKFRLKNSHARWMIPVFLGMFALSGAYIYYNTNILNTFRNSKENRKYAARYERTYSKYKNYPQPRIVDVKIEVDLYPDDIKCDSRGSYILINKNKVQLDTLHVQTSPWVTIQKLKFNIPVELIDSSKEYGYYMFKCLSPVLPGDTFSLAYDFHFEERGFHHWGHSTDLVANGTFLHGQFMPSFGYSEEGEIHDKKDRKKEGLPAKEFESPKIIDTLAYQNMYVNNNADRISFEATISTVPDQIAITCGSMVEDSMVGNRRYFKYKMKEPIWNFYPILSARYEVYKENYNGLEIAVYYHKQHNYNIDKMVNAVKKTVDYCSKNFMPYQHDVIRIVEFPRYGSFAQSFATTIPFSEGIGFIVDVNDKDDIDLPFFVSAHEVAHQWWAHQICGADVQGKTLTTESLAEYTALMVMLKEYGNDMATKFLKYELDRYMFLRATEKKKEPPLYLVDNQAYLSYQKGCIAFYNIRDFVGEDTLNKALARFIRKYNHQNAPYPTSLDLLAYVDQVVPDSLKYLMNDWFKTITLYDNRTDSVKFNQAKDGKYRVEINTSSKKYQADSLGKQLALPLSDWVDIGIYCKSSKKTDSLIYEKKVKLTKEKNQFSILVDKEPSSAGIDPQNKLIDRNILDNKKPAKKKR
jgi:ABC-2 type transport system permease protein